MRLNPLPKTLAFIMACFFLFPVRSFPVAREILPVQPRKVMLRDYEFLKYNYYSGGELSREHYLVFRTDSNQNTVTLYMDDHDVGTPGSVPDQYTDYYKKMKISLINASLIHSTMDYQSNGIKWGNKGTLFFDMDIDEKNSQVSYQSKIYDGYEFRTMKSRISIKPGYPVWDADSFLFLASSFLDLKSPGVIFIIAPEFCREAIPICFKFAGKEVVETQAGKFNTVKYRVFIADPFLSKLMESMTREFFVWVEDNERGLVVKAINFDKPYILEKIGEWSNR